MGRKVYTPEQIIGKLPEAEVRLGQRHTVGQVSRKLDITEQTYYRWREDRQPGRRQRQEFSD